MLLFQFTINELSSYWRSFVELTCPVSRQDCQLRFSTAWGWLNPTVDQSPKVKKCGLISSNHKLWRQKPQSPTFPFFSCLCFLKLCYLYEGIYIQVWPAHCQPELPWLLCCLTHFVSPGGYSCCLHLDFAVQRGCIALCVQNRMFDMSTAFSNIWLSVDLRPLSRKLLAHCNRMAFLFAQKRSHQFTMISTQKEGSTTTGWLQEMKKLSYEDTLSKQVLQPEKEKTLRRFHCSLSVPYRGL